jgi:hypothetical protein
MNMRGFLKLCTLLCADSDILDPGYEAENWFSEGI